MYIFDGVTAVHPSEIPYITKEDYWEIPPLCKGWLSRVQPLNNDIPHICPYFNNRSKEFDWRRGWEEAGDDLAAADEPLFIDYACRSA